MTSLGFGTRSKNRLSHGATGIWISKRKIFETRLRLERISFARSGQKLIIGSTNGLFDCVYGRRRITGLRCAEPDTLVGTARRAVRTPQRGVPTISNSALDVER